MMCGVEISSRIYREEGEDAWREFKFSGKTVIMKGRRILAFKAGALTLALTCSALFDALCNLNQGKFKETQPCLEKKKNRRRVFAVAKSSAV